MDIVYFAEATSTGDARDGRVRLPGLDQETADALAERAHELCPYSKATRGNIEVTVTAVID